jgi:hypothetical protein
MFVENPTWGAPRIHGELRKLGFELSERTISRWMKRAPRGPERGKRWLAFLRNDREAIAAMVYRRRLDTGEDVDASARRVVDAKQDFREGDFAARERGEPELQSRVLQDKNIVRIYNRTVVRRQQAMLLISRSPGVLANHRYHSKIHAADCADCETKEGMLDRIESDLEFAERLTQEQRSKLLEIAEKCPVHRTLVSEIDIRSRVL